MIDAALARTAAELATPLEMPRALHQFLSRAIAAAPDQAAALVEHYTRTMPRMRAEQLAHPLFTLHLDWSRLPRMSAAIERLRALVTMSDPRAPTIGALYARAHYGALMPMLYAYPADLAYFQSQDLDAHATIDRYLTAPVIHDLCHLSRDRDTPLPPHLDECVAGWLGAHVHPEMVFPAPGEDDALFSAPLLSQVGQAIARAFGIDATIRAHAGLAPWPAGFAERAARLGWDDWLARRTHHLLSDTQDPSPWLALVEHAPDPDFDRVIVADALRAMCLEDIVIAGSCRARTRLPVAPIAIAAGTMRCGGARYWVPACVPDQTVELRSLDDIPRLAAELTSTR